MTLPDDIREACATGAITGLTLWPTELGWQAGARRASGAYTIGVHADPAEALRIAIVRTEHVPAGPNTPTIFD